uniref:Uncharacterized protein n=1 Tax=Ixodes ricinus TaxID=34613 RepID=A0A6B0UTX3_IXORI
MIWMSFSIRATLYQCLVSGRTDGVRTVSKSSSLIPGLCPKAYKRHNAKSAGWSFSEQSRACSMAPRKGLSQRCHPWLSCSSATWFSRWCTAWAFCSSVMFRPSGRYAGFASPSNSQSAEGARVGDGWSPSSGCRGWGAGLAWE